MGLLLLFRSEAIALLFVYAAILVVLRGWKALGHAAIFVLVALICFAPWVIRNYLVFRRFVPATNAGGLNLWYGHNPLATGSNRLPSTPGSERDKYMDDELSLDVKSAVARLPLNREYEVARDDVFKQSAIQYMRTHPKGEAYLVVRKLFLFFAFDPNHRKGRNPADRVPSILLTLLAFYGASQRGRLLLRDDLLVLASILFAVAVCLVIVVLPRYKIVIDPFLMILAANIFARPTHWNLLSSSSGARPGPTEAFLGA